jgi:hypothetical protein
MAGSAIVNMFKSMIPDLPSATDSIRKGMFSNIEEKPPKLTKPEMVIGPEGISRISGMIGDSNSKFDQDFKLAEQMRRRGELNEDIIARTGFWFDEAGTPKYELDDSAAELNFDPAKVKAGMTMTAKDFMNHDKLFSVYPDLADMRVKFIKDKNPENKGYADIDKGEIGVNVNHQEFVDGDPIALMSTMLHETQHAIQKREKFDQGGDWRNFLKDPDNFTRKEYEEAFKKYLNIAGEIEARNVELRYANPKAAKKVFDYNKKIGMDLIPPVPNVVRSRNFLQTLAKDPQSVGYGVDPRMATTPAGEPARMMSDDLSYQDPFERTIR